MSDDTSPMRARRRLDRLTQTGVIAGWREVRLGSWPAFEVTSKTGVTHVMTKFEVRAFAWGVGAGLARARERSDG